MDFATYFTIEWQVIFSFEFYYRKLADYLLVDSSVHPVSWPDLVVYQSGQVLGYINPRALAPLRYARLFRVPGSRPLASLTLARPGPAVYALIPGVADPRNGGPPEWRAVTVHIRAFPEFQTSS